MGHASRISRESAVEIGGAPTPFAGPVLTIALLFVPLACPPTTIGAQPSSDQFGVGFMSPYGLPVEQRPRAPRSEPTVSELPLWDPELALRELPVAEPDAHWIAWVLAWVVGRPATAHEQLVAALADDSLSAGRLLWWREQAVDDVDARDALADAWIAATATPTRALLAAAIALELWDASCPVIPAPDGACRVSSEFESRRQILRRDPITIEDAQRWTVRARELWPELAGSDPAVAAIEQELALASATVDYEVMLTVRLPGDLDFVIEEWRHGSGVPEWERLYVDQVRTAADSLRRVNVFFDSSLRCTRSMSKRHADAATKGDAVLATVALLREATIAIALDDALRGVSSREQRRWGREAREHGKRAWAHVDYESIYLGLARRLLEQCVEHGQAWGGQPVRPSTRAWPGKPRSRPLARTRSLS